MMTISTTRGARRRQVLALALLSTLALVASACGGSDDDAAEGPVTTPGPTTAGDSKDSKDSDSKDTEAAGDVGSLLQKAFQTEVDESDLDPIILETFERAATELSEEQLDLAFECWKASRCDIPDGGDVVLGIADGFGDNTWRRFSLMEAILQALTYPEIGEIVYTNASGDLATMQTNVRSLSAQGADVILTYNDFGPSAYPAYAAAQKAGAVVAAYVSPSPAGAEGAVTATVTADACQAGRDMAEAAAELHGEGGRLALFTGTPGNPQGATWQPCSEETAEEMGLEVVYRADTNWTPAGAFEAASGLIATGEEVDAILYDYSTPFVQVTEAYQQANASPPDYMAWTMDNGLFCQWEELQGGDDEFDLFFTNSLNWAARTSLDAAMKKVGGDDVPAEIIYPMPFVQAEPGLCQEDKPGDFPASTLVPESLVERMLG